MVVKGLSMYFQPIVWFIPSNRTDVINALLTQFGACYIADESLFDKYLDKYTQAPQYNEKGICTNLQYTNAEIIELELNIEQQ